MAAPKREEWQIFRDREEIAGLLARNRRMPHYRIAEVLNQRRQDDYRRLVNEAMKDLGADAPIPNVPPPYTLSRQMIDREVRVLEREFQRRASEKFEVAKAYHL